MSAKRGSLTNLRLGIDTIETYIKPGSGYVFTDDTGVYIDGIWQDNMSYEDIERMKELGWEVKKWRGGQEWLFR